MVCNNLTNFFQTLGKESESTIEWFKNSCVISNPDKFEAI